MSHTANRSLKTIGYIASLFIVLAIVDLVALSFLVGFGTGGVGQTTPLMGVLVFVGACVLLAPVNYVATKRILR